MTTTPDESSTGESVEEVDTESVNVQSTVPAYQRDEWDAHADELDMTRAEYVRTMVQAGRRAMSGEFPRNEEDDDEDDDLRVDVLEAIREGGHVSFDVLVSALAADFEERMGAVLDDLQNDDLIRYNGRRGGYVAVEEAEADSEPRS